MKKKVALLLVLSMILSILPMNVFGRNDVSPLTAPTNQVANSGNVGFINLEFQAASLPMPSADGIILLDLVLGGHSNDAYLRFTNLPTNTLTPAAMVAVHGQERANLLGEPLPAAQAGGWVVPYHFAGQNDAVIAAYSPLIPGQPLNSTQGLILGGPVGLAGATSTSNVGGAGPVAIPAELFRNPNDPQRAVLRLDVSAATVTPFVPGAIIHVPNVPVRVQHQVENPVLSVFHANTNIPVFNERPIGLQFGQGVAISAPDGARSFQQALLIPAIDIREQVVGALNGNSVISLVAPRGYVFSTDTAQHVVTDARFNVFPRTGALTLTNIPVPPADVNRPVPTDQIQVRTTRDGLQILQIQLTATRGGPLVGLAETIRIENLVLVGSPNAPATGDVALEVHVARGTFGTPAVSRNTLADFPAGTNWNQHSTNFTEDGLSSAGAWRNRNLTVGTRQADALQLTINEANPRDLLSGRRVAPVTGEIIDGGAPSTQQVEIGGNNSPELRTAQVRLTETAIGALGTDWNNVVEFHFDHPGVQLLAARWRVQYTTGTQPTGGVYDWQPVRAPLDPFAPRDWAPITAEFSSYIFQDSLNIFMPRHLSENRTRRLDVEFYVSVEAGFEWRYNENDISIRVGGSAANNLAANNREIVVATVTDPITMTLDGNPIVAPVGQVFNMMEPTLIPDIIIEETQGGALRRGQRIHLAVDAFPTAVLGGQSLSGGTITVDPASGLTLRVITATTGLGLTGIGFEVVNESRADTPATITISGAHLMGTIFPGVRYVVGIYGSAATGGWTRNYLTGNISRSVHGATFVTGQQPYPNTVNTGFFQSAPAYFVDIASVGDWATEGVVTPDDLPPTQAPGVGLPQAPGRTLTLWEGMDAIGDVDMPFFWQLNERDSNIRVGYVALRTFVEEFINGQAIPGTDGENTITGLDNWGNNVSIIVQNNNTYAIIDRAGNRELHDIAEFSGSGPVGSIRVLNVDGRVYLPLRFVAEAFGRAVRLDGNVVVFS